MIAIRLWNQRMSLFHSEFRILFTSEQASERTNKRASERAKRATAPFHQGVIVRILRISVAPLHVLWSDSQRMKWRTVVQTIYWLTDSLLGIAPLQCRLIYQVHSRESSRPRCEFESAVNRIYRSVHLRSLCEEHVNIACGVLFWIHRSGLQEMLSGRNRGQ